MKLTYQELITEIWAFMGEPTDLAPFSDYPAATEVFDINSKGAQKIGAALNRSQQAIAFWKDNQPPFRQFRWKDGFRHQFFQVPSAEAVITVIDSFTFTWDEGPTVAQFSMEGMYVLQGTNLRRVIASDITVSPYIHLTDNPHQFVSSVVNTPDATRYQPWASIPVQDDLVEILKVNLAANGTEVVRAPRDANFELGTLTVTPPSQWYRRNKRIYLNGLAENIYLEAEVLRAPTKMVNADDTYELPPQVQEAMIRWACGWGYGLVQELDARMRYQLEFMAIMRSTQFDDDYFFNLEQNRTVQVRAI